RSVSEDMTREIGRRLGEAARPGDVFALAGELGAGKTRFVQGLARGLGIDPDDVASPTFTMIAGHTGRLTLHHMDLYRMRTHADLETVGVEEYLDARGPDAGVSAVEWADRFADVMPPGAIRVDFAVESGDVRELMIAAPAERENEIEKLLTGLAPERIG
ncbi:MAG: tRNA (adenosine(37)-N6)-threonylcarbamoyltransferase complex ATPase subunit type 1 TsaE, partial [Deltaproteobacteria bacterium]|nr:tRNA (adenosine(37)-N6)-threonylcarbamoyltransferase complex ATPase subunit type 1 TsaE [Deltaproteobacteria bacterium]